MNETTPNYKHFLRDPATFDIFDRLQLILRSANFSELILIYTNDGKNSPRKVIFLFIFF